MTSDTGAVLPLLHNMLDKNTNWLRETRCVCRSGRSKVNKKLYSFAAAIVRAQTYFSLLSWQTNNMYCNPSPYLPINHPVGFLEPHTRKRALVRSVNVAADPDSCFKHPRISRHTTPRFLQNAALFCFFPQNKNGPDNFNSRVGRERKKTSGNSRY